MKFKYTYPLAFTLVLFALCQSLQGQQEITARLVIYDSLQVEGSKITLNDYDEKSGLYLGFNPHRLDVVFYNENGDIINHFNRFGEGPEEYRYKNFKVFFWCDESIVIVDGDKLKNYSYSGDFLGTINLDNDSFNVYRKSMSFYTDKHGDMNSVYYADVYSKYSMFDPNFYNDSSRKVFYNWNLDKQVGKRYVCFEENSIYTNGKVYYPHIMPISSLNSEKRVFDVIYPNEQKVFRYDIDNDFSFKEILALNANYFGVVQGLPFSQRMDNIQFKQSNSSYVQFSSFADTLLNVYFQGIDKELIGGSVEDLNAGIEAIPKYIQVLVGKKKLCKDIKLPIRVMGFWYVHNLDKIIFSKAPNEFDEENNTNTFLIGKIVY